MSINLAKEDEDRTVEDPLVHSGDYHLHYYHNGARVHDVIVSSDVYKFLLHEPTEGIDIQFPLPNEPHEERTCRFCYDDEESTDNPLIAPCKCSGSVKWVHRDCLDAFRSKSMNRSNMVRCSMCKQPFILERHDEKMEDIRQVHKARIAKDLLLFFSGFLFVILLCVIAVSVVNWAWFPLAPYLPDWWTHGGGRVLWDLLMGVGVFFASFAILLIMLLLLRCCVGSMDTSDDCFLMDWYLCYICLTPAPAPPPMARSPSPYGGCNCQGCDCSGCGGCGGGCGDCGGEGALVVLLIIFILLIVIGVIAFAVVSFLVISEACRRHVTILEQRSLAQIYPVKDLSSSEFVI